jgi:predicted membrane protein
MKKETLLRTTILTIMLLGIIYAIWEAITNWEKGFAGIMPLFTILPTALYGFFLFFPKKKK